MIGSMIVLTIGEILVFPAGSVLLDQLAPEGMRGTYFGASGFRSLGHFIGPWFGGWLLQGWGGQVLFVTIAGIVMASTLLYYKGAQFDQGRIMVSQKAKASHV
jgi:MFS family permease